MPILILVEEILRIEIENLDMTAELLHRGMFVRIFK